MKTIFTLAAAFVALAAFVTASPIRVLSDRTARIDAKVLEARSGAVIERVDAKVFESRAADVVERVDARIFESREDRIEAAMFQPSVDIVERVDARIFESREDRIEAAIFQQRNVFPPSQ